MSQSTTKFHDLWDNDYMLFCAVVRSSQAVDHTIKFSLQLKLPVKTKWQEISETLLNMHLIDSS